MANIGVYIFGVPAGLFIMFMGFDGIGTALDKAEAAKPESANVFWDFAWSVAGVAFGAKMVHLIFTWDW